jgi:hypothetical protein
MLTKSKVMEEQLNAFTFFYSYYEAAKELKDKERLAFYDAIMMYCFDGDEPEFSGIVKALFLLSKPNLSASMAKARAGAKGGKQTDKQTASKTEASGKQTASKTEANGKQTASDKDKDKGVGERIQDKDKGVGERIQEKESERGQAAPRSKFVPPSVDEVREYCAGRKSNVNAEQFVSFYASKGWVIGKQAMKDWKQAVITWEQRQQAAQPASPQAFKPSTGGRSFDEYRNGDKTP